MRKTVVLSLSAILIVAIIAAAAFLAERDRKEKLDELNANVKNACSELIDNYKKTGERIRDFEFGGEKYSLFIDTTGYPVFFIDGAPRSEKFFRFDGDKIIAFFKKDTIICKYAD